MKKRHFASDNYAGICPQAWQALQEANEGHARAYGDDTWTARACETIREIFETDCEVFFVFNGTAANSLALAALCKSYHSIICADTAHVETDECGAPEFFSNGTKILHVPATGGKIDLDEVEKAATRRSDIHYPKPRVLTVTQATEAGTTYSVEEMAAVGERAEKLGLVLHMDGARFANALAFLGVEPKQVTWQAGVDVLCLGGVKNGIPVGEAVVFFSKELAYEFEYRCKQAGQLSSKMRFLSAPWLGLFRDETWLKNAAHANRCARLLEQKLREVPGLEILFPCQANAVFVSMPQGMAEALHEKGWLFYTWMGAGARLMCSWDTTSEDVEAFVSDAKEVGRSAG